MPTKSTTKKTGPIKSRVMKFIKALESGKYKQGRGALAKRDGPRGKFDFCCLGVACEVAKANGCEVSVKLSDDKTRRLYDDMSGVMPRSVQKWYGFKGRDPFLLVDEERNLYVRATTANDIRKYDIRKYDFAKIAKLFRETLKAGKL